MVRLTLAFLLMAASATAEGLMDAAAFEAYTTGKTLSYAPLGGGTPQSEQYLPGRRIVWSDPENACRDGVWFPRGEAICFQYEFNPTPVCWHVQDTAAGLRAKLLKDGSAFVLLETDSTTSPLRCNDLLS